MASAGGGSAVVDAIIYCYSHCLWEFCVWSLFYAALSVLSSFTIISLGQRAVSFT